MVVRVEYDRSKTVCIQGHVVGLPMQPTRGGNFSVRSRPQTLPSLAPALCLRLINILTLVATNNQNVVVSSDLLTD